MKHYGLHRHFTGNQRGDVGRWSQKGLYTERLRTNAPMAIENPVSVEDLHATIYTAMGIHPKTAYEVEKDPSMRPKTELVKPSLTSLLKEKSTR